MKQCLLLTNNYECLLFIIMPKEVDTIKFSGGRGDMYLFTPTTFIPCQISSQGYILGTWLVCFTISLCVAQFIASDTLGVASLAYHYSVFLQLPFSSDALEVSAYIIH